MSEDKSNTVIHETVTTNADSIEIGAPTKGGKLKVYGDVSEPEAFKKRIDDAILVLEYAKQQFQIKIG